MHSFSLTWLLYFGKKSVILAFRNNAISSKYLDFSAIRLYRTESVSYLTLMHSFSLTWILYLRKKSVILAFRNNAISSKYLDLSAKRLYRTESVSYLNANAFILIDVASLFWKEVRYFRIP